jgi:hypothetical protein
VHLRSVVMLTIAALLLSVRFAFPRGCCEFGNPLTVVVLAALKNGFCGQALRLVFSIHHNLRIKAAAIHTPNALINQPR